MALPVALGVALALGLAAQPLGAQGDPLAGLSAMAASRLVDGTALRAGMARHPQGRVAVIVELAAPALPDSLAGPAADRALGQAVGAVQDRVLGRVLPAAAEGTRADTEEGLNLRRMDFAPVLALSADAALLARLAQDPEVLSIRPDMLLAPNLSASLPHIGVPPAIAAGATGVGWRVAVLDTGARRSHEFLSGRIVAAACYNSIDAAAGIGSLCRGGAGADTGIDAANDCDPAVLRGCGHGTHVAGIAAGYHSDSRSGNPAHGVARNAGIISISVFSRLSASACRDIGFAPNQGEEGCVLAYSSDIMRGLEQVWRLRDQHPIAAVNLSLGGPLFTSAADCDAVWPQMTTMIARLREAGIAPVIAAGNNGDDHAITWPACISSAVAVANVTLQDARDPTSNWGALVDLAAPGRDILSSMVRGGSDSGYGRMTGTSMAAPHVAGALAAMRSALPEASVDQLVGALRDSGTGVSWAGVSRPRLAIDRALDRLWQGDTATTTVLSGPETGAEGRAATFAVRVEAAQGTPAGTVSLRNRDAEIASAQLAGGRAEISAAALPVGEHRLTAVYAGAGRHRGSTSAELVHRVLARPANDDFADRVAIAGPGRVTGSTQGATREADEPGDLPAQHATSIWWSFTPAAPGRVTLDLAGSGIDAVLGVYTGQSLAALAPVALEPAGPAATGFAARAGTAYAIVVKGRDGAMGPVTLDLALAVEPAATATTLSGPARAMVGQPVELVARVTSSGGTPGGEVAFLDGGQTLARVALDAGGAARLISATLPAGERTLTARYLGAPGFGGSDSGAIVLSLTEAPPPVVDFLGGGAVFGFSDACAPGWSRGGEAVRVRYSPSELNDGPPSQVSIIWPTGSEHIALWGDMVPSDQFRGGAGRQVWSYFVFYPLRPLVRVVQRQVTQPAGASLADARELVLRLRVQNFGAQPGCAAVLAATLRRP